MRAFELGQLKKKAWLVPVLLFTISAWAPFAQGGWRTFTTADGLANNTIQSMLQDRSENLWFGTDQGVTRYDGLTFKTFIRRDGLGDLAVRSMLEDASGNIWFRSSFGGYASVYDGSTMMPFFTPESLGGSALQPVLADSSGNVWFKIRGGVGRYRHSSWTTITPSLGGLVSDSVQFMLERPAGRIWFVTPSGISRYDEGEPNPWITIPPPPLIGTFGIKSGLVDRSGNLWLGMRGDGGTGGIGRWDGSAWTTFTSADSLGGNNVISMSEDRSGNIWAATSTSFSLGVGRGVSRFDGSKWRTFRTADGLAADNVTSMLSDHLGNVWVGTYMDFGVGGGVSRYDGVAWKTFTTADGLAGDFIDSILEDRSGNLWFAANAGFAGPGVGVSRYDGSEWKSFTTADSLAGNYISSMMEDSSGGLWFATLTARHEDEYGGISAAGNGVSHFDGFSWRTFTTADSLASNAVSSMLKDRSGRLWFGSYNGDVSRFDGAWERISNLDVGGRQVRCITEDHQNRILFGMHDNSVVSRLDGEDWQQRSNWSYISTGFPAQSLLEDRARNLWVGVRHLVVGLVRVDDSTRTLLGTIHGLGANDVRCILQDRRGDLWFGTLGGGASRLDRDSVWTTFTTANGLGGTDVLSMLEDRSGNLWLGTSTHDVSYTNGVSFTGGAVTLYDGSSWRTLFTAEDLGKKALGVSSMMQDRSGALWFGTLGGGVSRYTPDRVPPQTIFSSKPPSISSSRSQTAVFAAFGETDRIQFSHRLDRSDSLAWTYWSSTTSWFEPNLSDGTHVLEVRARDALGNIDPTPASAVFEVHSTPPSPTISSPAFGEPIQSVRAILGTTATSRFFADSVWVRPSQAGPWRAQDAWMLGQSSAAVSNGTLAVWNTASYPDGDYDLRLSVTDSLGLVGSNQITVVVDNHAPFVDVTTPSRVAAATGGDVFTTNSEVHLYFPPHAFARDALVRIAALPDSTVPDTLAPGIVRVRSGYDISWSGAELTKRARLEFNTAGISPPTGTLAAYRSKDGSSWSRLGGTMEKEVQRVSLAIETTGAYALFVESGVYSSSGTVAELRFTPRVFSPTGSFADREVGISFNLGRPAPVTVRVYSRSGRMIREVLAGQQMNAGANLVRWDGRDRNGGYATDGLYLVTVEALGHTERKALAIVK